MFRHCFLLSVLHNEHVKVLEQKRRCKIAYIFVLTSMIVPMTDSQRSSCTGYTDEYDARFVVHMSRTSLTFL